MQEAGTFLNVCQIWQVGDIINKRRDYPVRVVINDVFITEVIIDSHYEQKHSESINDQLILELVKILDKGFFEPVSISGKFSYFVTPRMEHQSKAYKLIWLMESGETYLGIINAYRSKDGLSKKK